KVFGEDGAAGIFVGNEILVLGQEKEGVHVPLHRGPWHVVGFFGRVANLPVTDRSAWAQGATQMAGGLVHLRAKPMSVWSSSRPARRMVACALRTMVPVTHSRRLLGWMAAGTIQGTTK